MKRLAYLAAGPLVITIGWCYAWFTARPLSPIEKLQSLGVGAFFLQPAQTSLYDADGSLTHLGHVYRVMVRRPTSVRSGSGTRRRST